MSVGLVRDPRPVRPVRPRPVCVPISYEWNANRGTPTFAYTYSSYSSMLAAMYLGT